MVTVYIQGDPDVDGKIPKTVEVRAGKHKILNSDFKNIPWKELNENQLCGRFIQVTLTIKMSDVFYFVSVLPKSDL